ncbi:MAG: ligase-associated DNA damage response DEXH box helicase [Pirellulales bacterium]
MARLRRFKPNVRVWGLSATIGNLSNALVTLLGHGFDQAKSRLIRGDVQKEIDIRSLLPDEIERFPWAGHLGDRLAGPVSKLVQQAATTLIFTNTRSQSEIWYRSLLNHLPELAGLMAVHHGSLDTELRTWIERQLRSGKLRCCVCTSSLDLGVDFPTVDQVIQVGSPKGNARLVQRAGRSGHRPHVPSRIVFVPTHALELVELLALRKSVAAGQIEPRIPLHQPLDVLAQHVVSMALAGGFEPDALYKEVTSTAAYHELSQEAWRWVLDFVERGGSSLQAYPDYHRIHNIDGKYQVTDRGIARRHRMSIGTIVSDASVQVKFLKGKAVGSVEESFVSRMEAGDRFMLAGKVLELVKLQDNTAWVRRAKGNITAIPRWMGGRMPLSTELSQALREELEIASSGKWDSAELQAVRPLLELQQTLSVLPTTNELLIERWESRDGHHLFLYPFEGRLAHEGLAALLALRFSRLQPITFSMAMNDYGIVFVSENAAPIEPAIQAGLFSPENMDEDIAASLNGTEMWRRQFRETARIAGLLHQGYPGERKKASHLQASSNLFFEVFRQYDPSNLLLRQAQREVLDQQLEKQRMILALERMLRSRLIVRDLPQPSPLCFPLLVDRLRDRLSSETLADRVRKLQQKWESEADRRTANSGR